MLIWPGVRRNVGGGAAQAIRNAPFWAPLKTSLTLARGTGSPTFTRATVGTVMGYAADAEAGASQVLLTCAIGEARHQGARRVSEGVWSPVLADGTAIPEPTLQGYLAEGGRTNLETYSQEFDNAAWTKLNATVSANAAVAPDGTTTADKLIESAGAGVHLINGAAGLANGTQYAQSVHAIAAERSWIAIGNNINATTYFNLSAGTVGTSSASSAGMEALPDGGYRCWQVATPNGPGGKHHIFLATGDGVLNYTGNGASGAYLWGAQLEAAAFASTYIPTTTAAVTRNGDVDSLPTAGNILAAQGMLYMEITPQHAPSGTVFFWGTYVDASNYTALLHDGTNLIFRKRISATNYDATVVWAFTSGTTAKVAASWGASGTTVYLNGTAGTPHANTTAAQIAATMQIGADGNGANQPFAAIKNYRGWQRRLPDAVLQAITT